MKQHRFNSILSIIFERYMHRIGALCYAFDPNDEADKSAVKAMIDEAVAGLSSKNKELLAELKEARKGQQIAPEVVEKLEAQIDSLKAELSTAQSTAKTAQREADQAKKALESEAGFTQKLLVENGLNNEISRVGVVEPEFAKALKSMFSGMVQIVADGDQRVAKVGEKSLTDFMTEWAKTDAAKVFLPAGNNSGGGAQGGAQKPNQKTMTRTEYETRSAAGDPSVSAFFKDGGVLVDQ